MPRNAALALLRAAAYAAAVWFGASRDDAPMLSVMKLNDVRGKMI